MEAEGLKALLLHENHIFMYLFFQSFCIIILIINFITTVLFSYVMLRYVIYLFMNLEFRLCY